MNHSKRNYRQIHLDFHTSEHIPNVGIDFNPDIFAQTLQKAKVSQVTLFGRCHHGWTYYESKIGQIHPNLITKNLLDQQVEACRKYGVDVALYNTVQWDELTAREHPGWRVMTADGSIHAPIPGDHSTQGQLSPTWHAICLSNKDYVQYVIDLTLEQIKLFSPVSVFLDILLDWNCVCPSCLAKMEQERRDPLNPQDLAANDRQVIMEYYQEITQQVWSRYPRVQLFHNSGHIYRGDRERYQYFSHIEMESLPTGGWGYDHFPMSVSYAPLLKKPYLGMTGKFHTLWGEFGGFKTAAALEYECTMMMAHGAACSIGDQLHPYGTLEPDTYDRIGKAYQRVEALEPFCKDSTLEAEIGVLSSEAFSSRQVTRTNRTNVADAGVTRMLLQLHYPFHLLDQHVTISDLSQYKVLILPDDIKIDGNIANLLKEYGAQGGKIFASGTSGFDRNSNQWILNSEFEPLTATRTWNPDYLQTTGRIQNTNIPETPFVVYHQIHAINVVDPKNVTILYNACSPFFNRSYKAFCSHLHTPPNPKAKSQGQTDPAILMTQNLAYSALPIFSDYFDSGQTILRSIFQEILLALGYSPRIKTNLPTAGKITLTSQPQENRTMIHLLYAPSQLRGNGLRMPEGNVLPIEIIDDVPSLNGVSFNLITANKPSKVYSVTPGATIDWVWKDGVVTGTLDTLYIHDAVVIQY